MWKTALETESRIQHSNNNNNTADLTGFRGSRSRGRRRVVADDGLIEGLGPNPAGPDGDQGGMYDDQLNYCVSAYVMLCNLLSIILK